MKAAGPATIMRRANPLNLLIGTTFFPLTSNFRLARVSSLESFASCGPRTREGGFHGERSVHIGYRE
jgi:hypothetical protein